MDFQKLSEEILIALRGRVSQKKINDNLGVSFNKISRWESGRDQADWSDFVKLAGFYKAPLKKSFADAFSFYGDISDAAKIIRHFTGNRTIAEISREFSISRYTLSRWLTGSSEPSLAKILEIIFLGSAEFYRFIEMLADSDKLSTIQEGLKKDRTQLEMFFRYPWLSALLSAIDLTTYQKNPTISFLSEKAKIPADDIQAALIDMEKNGLLVSNGTYWVSQLHRIGLRGSVEMRKKANQYAFSRALDAVDTSFGSEKSRFSYKLFSLNEESYKLILQRYTEFFNDVGKIIDQGQTNASKIYVMPTGIIDYEDLPLQK